MFRASAFLRFVVAYLLRSETTSALRWHGDCSLGSSLVDSDRLMVELGKLLRRKLQAAGDRVLVSILDDAVNVVAGTARDGATLAHANIDHEATVVAFLEEMGS